MLFVLLIPLLFQVGAELAAKQPDTDQDLTAELQTEPNQHLTTDPQNTDQDLRAELQNTDQDLTTESQTELNQDLSAEPQNTDQHLSAEPPGTDQTIATETIAAERHEPGEAFHRALYHMSENNHAQALAYFYHIEQQNHLSGPLYYNMGLSHLALGATGHAAVAFHRSARFRDTREQAQLGLDYIEYRHEQQGTWIPYLPRLALVDRLMFHVCYFCWGVAALVLLNAGALLLAFIWLTGHYPRMRHSGALLALSGLGLLVLTGALTLASRGYTRAVIVHDQVELLAEPGSTMPKPARPMPPTDSLPGDHTDEPVQDSTFPTPGALIDLAYEAYTVTLYQRISRRHPGWVYIRLRNGLGGWVPEHTVVRVP